MTSIVTKAARKGAQPSAKGARQVPRKAPSGSPSPRKKSKVDIAIAKKLAPAAAIALLEKTEQAPDALAPALDILGAGVSRAEADGKIRVQLAFDGGEILPVEMSAQAGKALAAGLSEELGAKPKSKR
ncbi:MAG: hypothetical protein M3Y55_08140 [Pseudomonadota bacterium]|nr:hypothetical protein [Pseudomonadota bacterium]